MSRRAPIADRLQKQIADLRSSGLSDAAIAQAVRVGRQTIWRYASGLAEAPRYRTVAAVEALHRKKIGEP